LPVPEYLTVPRFHSPLIEPGVRICRTRLSALHTAQRGLLDERRKSQGTSHPFFWASFVLVGDPGE
jgi:hypothetical protein